MVTLTRPQRLTLPTRLPPPPLAAAGVGGTAALVFLFMPAALLERLVVASGIAAIVAAAEPPLGLTARIAVALLVGGGVAAFAWVALSTLADAALGDAKSGGLFRRDDTHPDAPPRPPLLANRDLGAPFLDVRAPIAPEPLIAIEDNAAVEHGLPLDLDQPMAAFDPDALLAVPLPAPEPVRPLARAALIDPGDRIETFELTPVSRDAGRDRSLSLRASADTVDAAPPPPNPEPTPMIGPATAATVHDLLARLERGLMKPTAPIPESAATPARSPLEDTLGDLRRMATSAR